MASSLSRGEALYKLKKVGCSEDVISHCVAVSDYAVQLASKIRDNGIDVDVGFVEVAAILHDIGRSKTHGIRHGIEGAGMLKDYPDYARVCERHVGAGLTSGEARDLGLPEKDYLPESLEEKIIAHADNLARRGEIVSIEEALAFFKEKLGSNHPAVGRVKALNDYIESLIA